MAVGFVVMLGGVYLGGRHLFGHEAAIKRMPLMGAILVFGFAIAVVFLALPDDWGDKAWIALLWVGSLVFVGQLLIVRKRQRQAGAVLMGLGRDRASLIGWIAAFLAALLTFVLILRNGETIGLVSEEIFYLSWGGFFFNMWYEGRQLREGGVVSYGSVFRWDKIQRYDWKGETLSLWLNRRWPFSRVPVAFRIASGQKEAVDQILRERVQTEG